MDCTPDTHWSLFLHGCDFCLNCGKKLGTGPSGDTKTIGRSLGPADAVQAVLGKANGAIGEEQWGALMSILGAVLARGDDREALIDARREVASILRTHGAPMPEGMRWMG